LQARAQVGLVDAGQHLAGVTAMPSCSVVASTTPDTLDLMVAELSGASEPERAS
jgi:hypothetical protein